MRTQSYVFKLSQHIYFISWTFNNRICKAVSDFIRMCLYYWRLPNFLNKSYSSQKSKIPSITRWWKLQIYIWFGDFWGCCSNRQKHFASWQQREFIDHSLLSWERRQIKHADADHICHISSPQTKLFSPHNMASTKNIYMRCASTTNIYIWGMRVTFLGDAVTNAFHGDLPGLSEVQIVEWGQMRLVVKTDLRWPGIKTWSWKLNLSRDAVSEKKAIWKWERRKAINNISKAANSWKGNNWTEQK